MQVGFAPGPLGRAGVARADLPAFATDVARCSPAVTNSSTDWFRYRNGRTVSFVQSLHMFVVLLDCVGGLGGMRLQRLVVAGPCIALHQHESFFVGDHLCIDA
jgi:hypothetical protein